MEHVYNGIDNKWKAHWNNASKRGNFGRNELTHD